MNATRELLKVGTAIQFDAFGFRFSMVIDKILADDGLVLGVNNVNGARMAVWIDAIARAEVIHGPLFRFAAFEGRGTLVFPHGTSRLEIF